MGLDIYYQAVPEELVNLGRSDPAYIESLAGLPILIRLGAHELPRRPGGPHSDGAFWEQVLTTFRETPGLASRRFYGARDWDQLHWALSAERRRRRGGALDLDEPVPRDDLGTCAVRGEVVVPESVGVGERIRLNSAASVRAIAEWLGQVTRADLRAAWQPDVMATVPVYKGPNSELLEARFPYVCQLVDGLTSFYRSAAEHGEAVLVAVG